MALSLFGSVAGINPLPSLPGISQYYCAAKNPVKR